MDAEAIVDAALRPNMSSVAVKTKEQQAQAVIYRTRDQLLRQRAQAINALRGHLAEFGVLLSDQRALVCPDCNGSDNLMTQRLLPHMTVNLLLTYSPRSAATIKMEALVMSSQDWVLNVFEDIERYASENGLVHIFEFMKEARECALREAAVVENPEYHQGLSELPVKSERIA